MIDHSPLFTIVSNILKEVSDVYNMLLMFDVSAVYNILS